MYGPPPGAAGIIGGNIAVLAVLVGVPHTRRLHRVRARHIARSMVFGLSPLALASIWAGLGVTTTSAAMLASAYDLGLAKELAALGVVVFEALHAWNTHLLAVGWLAVYWLKVLADAWRLGTSARWEMSIACVAALVLAYAGAAVHATYWHG